MTDIILSKEAETSENKKYVKKYKCPYCELRLDRVKLEDHVEENHMDMIPKGFTPSRVVFNTVNKKTHGTCIICGKESPWNEQKKRYERLCGSKKCHDKYVSETEAKTHQHEKMKNDDTQKIMLNNRKTSGSYKFKDGGYVSYVGNYEKEFLKFMDNVMNFKSTDIETGVVLKYQLDGEEKSWFVDYYIPIYNLIIEIKDGGQNPNNAIPSKMRERQIAKEDMIKKSKKYNYIRLTDKNHSQFIEMLMLLKDSMVDFSNEKEKQPIIKINEYTNAMMGTMHTQQQKPIYIIDYMQNNVFSDPERKYAICRKNMSDIVTFSDGVFSKVKLEDFMESATDIKVYEFLEGADDMVEILKEAEDDKKIYEILTGKSLLDYNQIMFDPLFKETQPFSEKLNLLEECIYSSANMCIRTNNYCGVELNDFPILENGVVKTDNDVVYFRSIHGVYAKNISNGLCTPFFESVNEIPKKYIDIIK